MTKHPREPSNEPGPVFPNEQPLFNDRELNADKKPDNWADSSQKVRTDDTQTQRGGVDDRRPGKKHELLDPAKDGRDPALRTQDRGVSAPLMPGATPPATDHPVQVQALPSHPEGGPFPPLPLGHPDGARLAARRHNGESNIPQLGRIVVHKDAGGEERAGIVVAVRIDERDATCCKVDLVLFTSSDTKHENNIEWNGEERKKGHAFWPQWL